jgi:hypothetical protein
MGHPRQCEPSGREQQWRSGGAVEGIGKGFEGAPGVGVELGAALGGSKGDRVGGSRWLSNGKLGGAVAATGGGRGEMLLHGGCLFYSHRRWLAIGGVSCGQGSRAVAAVVQTRSARWHHYSDREADERGPCGFGFFPNYPN